MAFEVLGEDATSPGTVRQAAHFLLDSQNTANGAWSSRPDTPGDACNTARAISALLRTKVVEPSDRRIAAGVDFILASVDDTSGLWDVAQEPFFYSDAGGYIHYHQNTLCDVAVALSEAGYDGPEIGRIIKWVVSEMQPSGLWYLSSPNWKSTEIVTWSTAELILALDFVERGPARRALLLTTEEEATEHVSPPPMRTWFNRLAVGALVIVLTLTLLTGSRPWDGVARLWQFYDDNGLAAALINFVFVVVLLGIVIGVVGNWTYDRLKQRRRQDSS